MDEERPITVYPYNPEENKFKTLREFKLYLESGWNLNFEFHGVEYGLEGHDNSFDIWIANQGDIANGLTLEETMDFEFDGVKIRDFITTDEVEITDRPLGNVGQ